MKKYFVTVLILGMFCFTLLQAHAAGGFTFCTNDSQCPAPIKASCQSSKCIINTSAPTCGVCEVLTSYCNSGDVCHCNGSGTCVSQAQWYNDCVVIPNKQAETTILLGRPPAGF